MNIALNIPGGSGVSVSEPLMLTGSTDATRKPRESLVVVRKGGPLRLGHTTPRYVLPKSGRMICAVNLVRPFAEKERVCRVVAAGVE